MKVQQVTVITLSSKETNELQREIAKADPNDSYPALSALFSQIMDVTGFDGSE